ncbi:MAG: chemotaxis protein CheB [Nitrospirota bacterium]
MGDFYVVGIGASAGGLGALERFFGHVPSEDRAAYVVVQHLARGKESIMDSILQKYTAMPVAQARDGMKVEPDHVYLNPPDRELEIKDGVLYLFPPVEGDGRPPQPIDRFLRSLAADMKDFAIGVILSGAGTDGTLGMRAVKGEGGFTVVQDPREAEYDGMPRSAVDTGLVDEVLPVEQIPGKILEFIGQHAALREERAIPEEAFRAAARKAFMLVEKATGHDFTHYKEGTVRRRMARRMAINRVDDPEEYVRLLQGKPEEVNALFQDMLIGVTNFFRDRLAFEALEKKVLPAILKGRSPDNPVRVWVPGCSTGEEAYSIAMVMLDAMERMNVHVPLQVFGTDVDPEAIEHARTGRYSENIAQDVGPERLKTYFSKENEEWQVKSHLREKAVFAVQNLSKDPPFSQLDLISCRNVLIYMDEELQGKLMLIFHYSLKKGGFLWLGTSETVGSNTDLFAPVDVKQKIFRRREAPGGVHAYPLEMFGRAEERARARMPEFRGEKPVKRMARMAETAILEHLAPASVLVNERHQALYFHGETEWFLSPPRGEAAYDVLKMARKGVDMKLATALHRAQTKGETVVSEGLEARRDGMSLTFDLVVKPLREPESLEGTYLVAFRLRGKPERTEEKEKREREQKAPVPEADRERVAELEKELQGTREYLQSTVEELEASNEELRSANEELQSMNEELQSTNEELETAKEEMQSQNEEMDSLNAELESKVNDISEANSDLQNLLKSTELGVVFLDADFRIKRFTPAATAVLSLIASDVGRPLGDLKSKIVDNRLVEKARRVLDTLEKYEEQVQTEEGEWYGMRITPYRTVENVIDGVVLTFVHITHVKKAEQEAQEARAVAEGIVETIREPLLLLDGDLTVRSANPAFYRMFHTSPKKTRGKNVCELGDRQWDTPELRTLLDEVLSKDHPVEDFRVQYDFPETGRRTMLLNARKVHVKGREAGLILLAFQEVTGEHAQ